MKVENMTSSRGNKIANQFIIEQDDDNEFFQSYNSIIVHRGMDYENNKLFTHLDINKWDYSVTTSKYRNMFLGETKKETQAKIDSGEYQLVDLN